MLSHSEHGLLSVFIHSDVFISPVHLMSTRQKVPIMQISYWRMTNTRVLDLLDVVWYANAMVTGQDQCIVNMIQCSNHVEPA